MLADVTLAVCCNGSIGYDPAAAMMVWQDRLASGTAADLAALLAIELPDARFGAYDGYGWTVCHGYFELRPWRPAGAVAEASVSEVCQIEASALGICHPSLRASDIAAVITSSGVLAGRASVCYSGDDTLDVTPAGVDKGSGLLRAFESLGIDPLEAVGFGDAQNDLPMADVLGSFVAMGNADPSVLAVASDVTSTVAADGVPAWLTAAGMLSLQAAGPACARTPAGGTGLG